MVVSGVTNLPFLHIEFTKLLLVFGHNNIYEWYESGTGLDFSITYSILLWTTFNKIFFHRYGLECLFRFFSYGLEAKFRPELYKDFQAETLKDCGTGQLYGLEKFWAFVKYYKHADELHVEPQLKAKLEPFKTIEDFKVLYTVSIVFIHWIFKNSSLFTKVQKKL